MNTILRNRRRLLTMATATLAFPDLALSSPMSCYRAQGHAFSRHSGVTLVLIDATTAADTVVVKNLSALVTKSIRRPGERVLVASFAGMAPGQFPTVKADVMHERQPSSEDVESHVLDWTTKMHTCLSKLAKTNATLVSAAFKSSIATETSAPYSEIVAAVHWAMLDLLPKLQPAVGAPPLPTRLIVFSDGEQNSREGTSFYRKGLPREISAESELKTLASRLGPRGTMPLQAIDVWWIGIGLQPPGVKVYMTPRALEERRRFWTGALNFFGARQVNVGLTVPDDSL